jgi:hypothetical protein
MGGGVPALMLVLALVLVLGELMDELREEETEVVIGLLPLSPPVIPEELCKLNPDCGFVKSFSPASISNEIFSSSLIALLNFRLSRVSSLAKRSR